MPGRLLKGKEIMSTDHWSAPPQKEDFIQAVTEFFRLLSKNKQAEARVLLGGINGRPGAPDDSAWTELLRCLWEDLEDWRDDFDYARFEGGWLTHLTPPDLVSEPGLLGIDWSSGADPMEPGDGLLINIFFLDEPTDDTARFSLTKGPDGAYRLALDNIEVM